MRGKVKILLWLCMAFIGDALSGVIVSQESNGSSLPPSKPVLAPLLTAYNVVGLSWADSNGEDGCVVERSQDDVNWSVIATLAANVTNYFDTSVVSGQTLFYRVFATNEWAPSAYSSVRLTQVPAPGPPPMPAITNIVLELGLAIRLDWAPMVGVSGFKLERRITTTGEWGTIANLASNVFSYVDTNIVLQRDYLYRVSASNDLGSSWPSFPARITSQILAERATDTFDPAINENIWSQISGGQVLTSTNGFIEGNALWFGAAGERSVVTAPMTCQSYAIVEFDFRAGHLTNDLPYWEKWEGNESVLMEYSGNGINWSRGGSLYAEPGWKRYRVNFAFTGISTNIQFRWTQKNHSGQAGDDTWAIDNLVITGPLPTPMETPSLAVTPLSSEMIRISWGIMAGISHYIIERKVGEAEWTQIASPARAEYQFFDTNCVPSTVYLYRIKAVNALEESDFSQPVAGTSLSEMAAWQLQYLGSTNAPITATGPDGVLYVCRYAYNFSHDEALFTMDPMGAPYGLPYFELDEADGKLEIVFLRRKSSRNPGITYEVQFSDDLAEWSAGGELISIRDIDYRWEAVTWRDQVPLQKARYCRVAIRLVP